MAQSIPDINPHDIKNSDIVTNVKTASKKNSFRCNVKGTVFPLFLTHWSLPVCQSKKSSIRKAVFILVSVDVKDSRILTSTSKFNLTLNWWVSKNGPDHSLKSSRKAAVDVRKSGRRHQCENRLSKVHFVFQRQTRRHGRLLPSGHRPPRRLVPHRGRIQRTCRGPGNPPVRQRNPGGQRRHVEPAGAVRPRPRGHGVGAEAPGPRVAALERQRRRTRHVEQKAVGAGDR